MSDRVLGNARYHHARALCPCLHRHRQQLTLLFLPPYSPELNPIERVWKLARRLATRVDERVKKAIEEICNTRGLKINRFIEDALIDKLEELEDIEDLKKIRCEPTRPFGEILRELKLGE